MFRLVDDRLNAVEVARTEVGGGEVEQRSYGLFDGAFEERGNQVAQGGAAGGFARRGGDIDIAQRFLFVTDMSLFFEHAEFGADRGISGGVGEGLVDFGGAGALAAVKDIHDLAFAAAEVAMCVFAHITKALLQKQHAVAKVALNGAPVKSFRIEVAMTKMELAVEGPVRPMAAQRFARYAWLVLGYNLAVILWGAVVRATGSGAGCGDHWPLCNGTVAPLAPTVHTLIEFTHRVMSGLDLAAVAVLVIWSRRAFPREHAVRLGAALSGTFLITEALIGAGLVLLKKVAQNADGWWNSVHVLNTLALVGSLALTAWWASGHKDARPRGHVTIGSWLGLGSFALLAVSGVIAALGDTLFPARSLTQGFAQDFDPASSMFLRLRIWHPAIAAAVCLWILFYALSASAAGGVLRKLAYAVLGIMALQMAAGALNLLLLAPVGLQLLHLLLADVLWIALVLLVWERTAAAKG